MPMTDDTDDCRVAALLSVVTRVTLTAVSVRRRLVRISANTFDKGVPVPEAKVWRTPSKFTLAGGTFRVITVETYALPEEGVPGRAVVVGVIVVVEIIVVEPD